MLIIIYVIGKIQIYSKKYLNIIFFFSAPYIELFDSLKEILKVLIPQSIKIKSISASPYHLFLSPVRRIGQRYTQDLLFTFNKVPFFRFLQDFMF